MTVESTNDLTGLLRIGRIVAETMQVMADALKVGMTTAELDDIGGAYLKKQGARSAPILTYKYPGYTCISINDEAAHAIPGPRVIQPGDLVNIDVSAELNGYYADTGASFPMEPVAAETQKLCDTGRAALEAAVKAVRAGRPLSDIGAAVEPIVKRGGYRIIRELGGHGVGRSLHEPPHNIAHFYNPGLRQKMTSGMVFTVEPFISTGVGRVEQMKDGWTLRNVDGATSVQYEHTVVVTDGDPIVTTRL